MKPFFRSDETLETDDDIEAKRTAPTVEAIEQHRTPKDETMLKPSLRLFILPLGAVCTIAALASQNAPQAHRDSIVTQTRQEIAPCSTKPNADVCIISESAAR